MSTVLDNSTPVTTLQPAVVFLLDSSIPLYQTWPEVYSLYITHILRRFEELYGLPFSIGVVTYGTSDTQPSPLVHRRYFQSSSQIAADIRVHFANLGLGQTNKSGRRGMAMLDGLVAAIELFEGLVDYKTPQEKWIRFSRHILHVAACPPDETKHPLHNHNALLDSVTWETVGEELRKREIMWSLISLHKMPQLSELHSKAMTGHTSTPWFSVGPFHDLHLAGLPIPDKSSMQIGKQVQSAPDNKRSPMKSTPESQNTHINPKPAPPPPATSAPPSNSFASPSPASTLPPALVAFGNLPRIKAATGGLTIEQIYLVNEELKKQMAKVRAAQAKNDSAEMELLKKAMQPKMPVYKRAADIMGLFARMQQATTVAASTSGLAGPSTLASTGPPRGSVDTTSSAAPSEANNVSDNQAGSSLQSSALVENVQVNSPQSSTSVTPNVSKPHAAGSAPSNEPRHSSKQVWFGTLTWAGVDTATRTRKELRVEVKISSSESSVTEMRAETWPSVLELLPSPEPAVPEEDFRAWVTRLRPCVCLVNADARTIDQVENTHNLESLQRLLKGKPTYAIAAWPGPSGVREKMFLLSAFGNNGIVGAFFPNGIKEMPRPTNSASAASQYMPHQLLQLQQMRQAQALQAARSGVPLANPGQAAALAAAAIATLPQVGAMPGMNPAWPNNEMIQSFMARRASDGANPGSSGGM